jgi:hypothetical protein
LGDSVVAILKPLLQGTVNLYQPKEHVMRVLQLSEVQEVGGALTADQGLNIIAGIGAVAAALGIAPLAVCFAAGVYLGGMIVEAAA